MIKTETLTNETDILIAPELAFAIPCIVTNTGVSANSEGKKIIKAGTPITFAADVFAANRQAKGSAYLAAANSTGPAVYGYARWDIDVTAGDTNATLLVDGYVDLLKLDSAIQTLVTTTLTGDSNTATKARVRFIKGRAL